MTGIAGLASLPNLTLRELYWLCNGSYQTTADTLCFLYNAFSTKRGKATPNDFNPFSEQPKNALGKTKITLMGKEGLNTDLLLGVFMGKRVK